VVVIDLGRQGLERVDIIQHLHDVAPTAAVVVLTLCSDEDTRAQTQEAGAQAFLEKRGGAIELLQAIRQLGARRLRVGDRMASSPLAMRRLGVG
jgi:DNA-binding NarL/FixJ family response regulator